MRRAISSAVTICVAFSSASLSSCSSSFSAPIDTCVDTSSCGGVFLLAVVLAAWWELVLGARVGEVFFLGCCLKLEAIEAKSSNDAICVACSSSRASCSGCGLVVSLKGLLSSSDSRLISSLGRLEALVALDCAVDAEGVAVGVEGGAKCGAGEVVDWDGGASEACWSRRSLVVAGFVKLLGVVAADWLSGGMLNCEWVFCLGVLWGVLCEGVPVWCVAFVAVCVALSFWAGGVGLAVGAGGAGFASGAGGSCFGGVSESMGVAL